MVSSPEPTPTSASDSQRPYSNRDAAHLIQSAGDADRIQPQGERLQRGVVAEQLRAVVRLPDPEHEHVGFDLGGWCGRCGECGDGHQSIVPSGNRHSSRGRGCVRCGHASSRPVGARAAATLAVCAIQVGCTSSRQTSLDVPKGLQLIAGLTGFADAGGAVTQLGEYLLDTLETTVVATFDMDELLDYRARRPTIYFDQDHLTDYTPSTLNLYLANDELGAAVPAAHRLRARLPVGALHRRDAAAHRPLRGVDDDVGARHPDAGSAHPADRRDRERQPCGTHRGHVDLEAAHPGAGERAAPARVPAAGAGAPTAGFVLLIPHYLADTEYPAAAVTALESVSAATGLIFPTDRLREEGRDFVGKIDGQVEGNQELAKLVGTLEERHDSYMEENPLRSPLTDTDGELPTADEIAAELQNFLASRRSGEDDRPKA